MGVYWLQGIHMIHCAYNSMWIGATHLIQPDWDMFQTDHICAKYHAGSRAICGGPIHVSDSVGGHCASYAFRFGSVYSTLQVKLTRTLVHAFLDPNKALTQHYGAIQGLAALGPQVVRYLILPNLKPYLKILEPELTFEKQKNIIKRHEAWRVYGALLRASGHCIHDLLKMFPVLPSPPANTMWKNKGKIATARPNKRSASTELIDEQPPQKKTAIATDGPMEATSNNITSSSDMQVDSVNEAPSEMQIVVAASTSVPNPIASDINPSPSAQASDETASSSKVRSEKGSKRSINMSATLNQVWKEELKSGRVLASLSEQFAERLFPFIPTPEMYLFL